MSSEQASAAKDIEELHREYLRDYDPYSPNTIAEQLTELADRRQTCPVSYSARGHGFWVLTRYDDIAGVLRRSNRGFVSFPNDPLGENSPGSNKAMIPIELDGAEHRQYRAILDPIFSPKRVAALEPELVKAANSLIDEFIESGRCDFVNQFGLVFPGATVMAIMGWPLEDLPKLFAWTSGIMHGVAGGTQEEINAARGAAHMALREYLLSLIAQRRQEHKVGKIREDVTGVVLEAEVDGKKLTDDELFDLFLLMVLAGLDTVQSVLAQSVVYFADHPEKWDEMFAVPERIGSAVEELVRWASPPVPTRTVVADSVEVGGMTLPAGERVHFPLAVGNRDPEAYPNPDEIIFDRDAKPHLGFGLGAHRCIGIHLARLELRIAFTELHRRIPRFTVDSGQRPKDHLGLAWGVENVHLVFPPGPRES